MPADAPLVRIGSKAAGVEGVVVRVLKPAKPRYQQGAPVVVNVDGGFSRGNVDRAQGRLDQFGFVNLLFLFPGGESAPQPDGTVWRSGGAFDYRGADSMRALADVLVFAQGRTRTLDGKTLAEVAGVPVLADEAGVIGWSLGGNVVAGALGLYGKEIANLKWYASFESPYGDGIINAEFGSRGRPNRFYNADTGELDLRSLAWDKNAEMNSMPPRPPGLDMPRGVLFLDANKNGVFDPDTDVPFNPAMIPVPEPRAYFSPPLARAARDKKVFGDAWPAHIGTLEQSEKAMTIRNGVSHVQNVVRNVPRLAVIVWSSEQDHVQGTADYRHIRAQYDAYQAAGVRWIRLNPGVRWVEEVMKRKPEQYRENPPNASYDRFTVRKAVAREPQEGGPPDPVGVMAAACELADRTRRNEW
ncbi:MAG: hypothetical protein HY235_25100 [Acidobacteria bacterium]|nr:hypothetical protein [Acidobacteriota bacterium]